MFSSHPGLSETKAISDRHRFALTGPFVLAYGLRGAKTPLAFSIFFVALCVFFYRFTRHNPQARIPRRIFIPFVLFLAWCALSLVSQPALDSYVLTLGRLIAYALFGFMAANIASEKTAAELMGTVLVCGLVESLLLIGRYPIWGTYGGYLAGNPGYAGLLIASALCSCLVFLQRPTPPSTRRKFLLAAFVVLIAALFLTHSRGAILGFALAGLYLIRRQKVGVRWWIFPVVFLLPVLLWPEPSLRYLKIDLAEPDYWLGRLIIWKTAALALMDRCLLGFGLGNFGAAYRLHQQPSWDVLRYEKYTTFAHNDFLQIAVEAGLPALVFLVWGLLEIGRFAGHARQPGWIKSWSLAVCAVYAIFSLFNFSFYLPTNGLTVSACLGFLVGAPSERGTADVNWARIRRPLTVINASLAVFLLLIGSSELARHRNKLDLALKIMPARSDLWYERAMEEIGSNRPATESLRQTIRWNRWDPFAWSRLAKVLMVTGPHSSEQIDRTFQEAERLAPGHAPFFAEHGFYALSTGRPAESKRLFERVIDLEPNAPLGWYGLALSQIKQENRGAARRLLQKAEALQKEYGNIAGSSPYAAYLFSPTASQINAARRGV